MSILLEQAQRDLQATRSDASKAEQTFKAAVAKLKAAQNRVDRLLITQMEADHEMAVVQRRARAGRS
jgi:ATP phosphoribosyltransferase regulatory subunit HisZ